jgi:hypothetical protein
MCVPKKCGSVLLFVALAMVYIPSMVCAQYSGALGLSGLPNTSSVFGGNGIPSDSGIPRQEGFYVTAGLRKYINSFTSKEFPSDPRNSDRFDPESRLEFPWQQTLGVIKLGGYYYGVEVNFEGASTLFVSAEPMIQDGETIDLYFSSDYRFKYDEIINGFFDRNIVKKKDGQLFTTIKP